MQHLLYDEQYKGLFGMIQVFYSIMDVAMQNLWYNDASSTWELVIS